VAPCGTSSVPSLAQETAFGDPRNGVFFVGADKVFGKNIPKMLHIWGDVLPMWTLSRGPIKRGLFISGKAQLVSNY